MSFVLLEFLPGESTVERSKVVEACQIERDLMVSRQRVWSVGDGKDTTMGLSVEDTGSTFIVTSVLLLAADDDDGGGSGMTSTFASGFLLVVTSSSLIFVRDRFLLLSLSFPSPPSLLLLFPLLLRFTRRALPCLRLGLLFLLLLLFAAAPSFGFLSLL